MAAQNRHLRGEREEVLSPVHGNVVVEAGDLMFLDNSDGVRGASTSADNYAYPFSSAVNAASKETGIINALYTQFLGVAMESSPSGTTENISVATNGVFRYPLYRNAGTTIGATVSSVSMFTSGTGVSDQTVFLGTSAPGSTALLGYIVKTESGASFVDFQIRTAFGSSGLAT